MPSPIVAEQFLLWPRGAIFAVHADGRKTTFFDQVRVGVTTDMRTITGSVVLTRGILHGGPPLLLKDGSITSGDCGFCWESEVAPKGLPFIDNAPPVGSPFKQEASCQK